MATPKYEGSYEKLTDHILTKSLKKMQQVYKKAEKAGGLEEAIKKEKYTNKQLYWDRISKCFIEIQNSIEKQHHYPMFLKSFSPSYEKQGFGRASQFIHHIENYLGEVYILHERLTMLLNVIKKESKAVSQWTKDEKVIKALYKYVEDTFDPILKARGAHTHVSRMTDEELNRLSTIEYLLEHAKNEDEKKLYLGHRKIYLLFARHKWKRQIKHNTMELEKLLDYICYYLKKSKILDDIAKSIEN